MGMPRGAEDHISIADPQFTYVSEGWGTLRVGDCEAERVPFRGAKGPTQPIG